MKQVIIPKTSLFLPRFSLFSSINTPWIAENLWLISRVVKKLILTVLTSVFVVSMEEWFFGSPYSAILANVSVLSL